MNNRTK